MKIPRVLQKKIVYLKLNKIKRNQTNWKIAVNIIIENIVDKPLIFYTGITKANNTLKIKRSKFHVLANAGIEKSGVTVLSSGKSTWRTGVGIGYQLSKKLSIQSGFYSSDKKYSAGPG